MRQRTRPSSSAPKTTERGHGNEGAESPRGRRPVIYGVLPVLEALRANARRIDKVMIAEGAREHRLKEIVNIARRNAIAVHNASRTELTRIAGDGINHQGVVAFTSAAEYVPADEILRQVSENALYVILDGVEDPRNFGAIIRTAECAGAGAIFIPERRAVGLTETVAKSSAGAVEHARVAKVPNINRLIDDLKSKNVWVVGSCGSATMDYTDWDWRRPSALVLGGEGGGLHRLTAEKCDVLVKVPMYGRINSLNVSVAAGVILFEARRQRSSEE